jgi:hypothetical protein
MTNRIFWYTPQYQVIQLVIVTPTALVVTVISQQCFHQMKNLTESLMSTANAA